MPNETPDAGDGGSERDFGDADLCPGDPDKTEPGICGCGLPDTDTDSDGTADCEDQCASDPLKTEPGACGCGMADTDADGDGSPVCEDCDDDDDTRHPGATDDCGGGDEDCDGMFDEDCVPDAEGCSDGTREGYVNGVTHPDIAACDAGWSIPGSLADGVPRCDRESGNDGLRVDGVGCDIDDACAVGWHVCATPAEVGRLGGSCDAAKTGRAEELFVAAVSGEGSNSCAPTGANNVFGCGSGALEPRDGCGVLDTLLANPCTLGGPTGFDCSASGPQDEAIFVVKGAGAGGVLCCRDGA